MLVDDEAMILEVGRRMIEKLGYKVLIAEGGKEALRLVDEAEPEIDLVILDMIMPRMNGEETFRQLKVKHPKIKVLLSSGYSLEGQAQDILNMGCRGFIQKPFNLIDLSQMIKTLLVHA